MIKHIAIIFFCIAFWAGAAWAVDYSADMISGGEGYKSVGKFYSGKNKSRVDNTSGDTSYNITRFDKGLTWTVMPKKKKYSELRSPNIKIEPPAEEKMSGEIERKQVGTEDFDGHPTIKYLITQDMGGNREQVYMWLATDINVAVKFAAENGSWFLEYRNVKVGPQPDKLFEVPVGYKKLK